MKEVRWKTDYLKTKEKEAIQTKFITRARIRPG
jgi:hypothetical protein